MSKAAPGRRDGRRRSDVDGLNLQGGAVTARRKRTGCLGRADSRQRIRSMPHAFGGRHVTLLATEIHHHDRSDARIVFAADRAISVGTKLHGDRPKIFPMPHLLVHQRLPEEVHREVFQFVLRLAVAKKLVAGPTVAASVVRYKGENRCLQCLTTAPDLGRLAGLGVSRWSCHRESQSSLPAAGGCAGFLACSGSRCARRSRSLVQTEQPSRVAGPMERIS
jgi:hypothetical protein